METEIKSLVEQSMQVMIVRAFKEAPEAIDALVTAALSQEVDEFGGKPDYHSRKKMPYLEFLVGNTIRQVARAAVVEAVQSRESDIKEAVQKAVSADKIVDGCVETILGALKQDYRISVQFADEKE